MKHLDHNHSHREGDVLTSEETLWPAELQEALAQYPRLEVGRDFNVRVMQRLQARAQPTVLDHVAAFFARPLPKLLGSFGMGTLILLPALWVMKPFSDGVVGAPDALANAHNASSLIAQSPTPSDLHPSPLSSSAALRYGALMREEGGDFAAPSSRKPHTHPLPDHAAPTLDDPRRRSLCPQIGAHRARLA